MGKPLELKYSEEDYKKWTDRLIEKSSELPNGCILWDGTLNSYGYGVLKLSTTSLCGEPISQPVKVHRLALYLQNPNHGLDPGLEASHLCHHKTCINPAHLSLEQTATNTQRKLCVVEKKCFGHGPSP